MAWITKNSGGMQIDRRSEPYLTDAIRQEIEERYAHRYPTRQAMTLPLLHRLQEEYGWLPFQAIEEAAGFLETPASAVMDTATFYEEFHLEPQGKYVIWVCQSISCEIMKSPELIDKIKAKLSIEVGQTSDDGRFTLHTVECLGACGGAPCALVNHKLHENLTPDNLDTVLDALP